MGQIYKGSQLIIDSGGGWSTIVVDSALSTTSENPVQNKVITEALNEWLVIHSATAPATPEDWMLWYDETNEVLKIYSETDTEWKEVWVEQITYSATAPTTPTDWQLRYDETNKVLKIYSEDDTEWKELWEWWVTSINGNTGDITMSTWKITLTQNWVEAGHFFLDQTVDKTIEIKWVDKSWKNKTVTNGELELWIRTICYPSADFTLTKPTELIDWEEYVVRFINWATPFNMTLGHGFTNPFGVDLSLSADAKDQFTFLAIEWILELQPAPVLVAPTENPQAPTGLAATVSGTTWTIVWTDPLDAWSNTWSNTKLVRKAWSEPTSVSDGTVLVTSTTRNQYQSTWYDDTWLTAWTTYYYRAFAEFSWWEVLWSASANITPALNSLCFTAEQANSTVQLNRNWSPTAVNLETSTDWTTWTDYTIWNSITLANVGDKVYMRNKSETDTWFSTGAASYYKFSMTWKIWASWDITSLLNKNWTDKLSNHYFSKLFLRCASLTAAPELPATTLATHCYLSMFQWCTNLTTPPELPATALANYCYNAMFNWCTSLTTAPELPATTLAEGCYYVMFQWCTSLATLPELPATTLIQDCYWRMFDWCTSIKLSETQTLEYSIPYRIPTTWTWTTAYWALQFMFANTWWTFQWEPTINTTYYLSNWVTPPTPWAYTYSQIIADAYATNWWWHIMSAELNTAPDVYFASLQASGNLSQQWSVYYISHDPTSIAWNDVITWYEIFYNPSYQQWIMQMRDMTYDQIVYQATVQGTFNWLLPLFKTNVSTYYTNLTNSGNMVEVQNPGSKFYMCADGTASTITEIWWEKIYYIPELWDWEIEANYGYWTYNEIIAKATADGNFYWTMMEMNRSPNGYLIDLTQSGHIYQVWDNYWLSADGTSAYELNWTVLRYQWTFDEWSIWAA